MKLPLSGIFRLIYKLSSCVEILRVVARGNRSSFQKKTKLGIQSLSYVGPNTWNGLPDNLKSTTSANSFKYFIKEYFLKKLGNVEADIYRYN